MNPRTRRGRYHEFSSEEIAEAERKFKEEGGLVQMLPEQPNPGRSFVPTKYLQAFEIFDGIIFWENI